MRSDKTRPAWSPDGRQLAFHGVEPRYASAGMAMKQTSR